MNDFLTTTQSLCRHCGRLIAARVCAREDGVWLEKICPEHGSQQARVYGDTPAYLGLGLYHRPASVPLAFAAEARGCPDSCGLCPDHEQHICLPILEITDHCNLDCPICLVRNSARRHLTRKDVAGALDKLIATEGQIDVLNLSGGEPTVNPYFRDIIEECVARKEILRVSVSTNGLVLARDPELLQFLADRRIVVSLQFDGSDDNIYVALRGKPLLVEKLRLIEACAKKNVSMSLTATVVSGINDGQLAGIANLLFQHEHILSLMFQPAAYAGNASKMPRPENRITIPEVIRGLHGAVQGMVNASDFSPLPCSHPACFSLAFYLKVDGGRFLPVKSLASQDRYLSLVQNRALFGTDTDNFRQVTDAVYDLWAGTPVRTELPRLSLGPGDCAPDQTCACQQFLSESALKAIRGLIVSATANGGYSPKQALQTGERAVKSIFIHQFMDRETFDLSRARKCCQVYLQPDGRTIPACVHNCMKRGAI